MGRPLPGSAAVRIAEYDLERESFVLGSDGLARECRTDRVGMLMARVRPDETTNSIPLRGVFGPEDAWLATGDLFRRDGDGDYWRIDSVADVIHKSDGFAFTTPIRDALASLPAVDMAVAYGVGAEDGPELAVAAITLRSGGELRPKDIAGAMRRLDRVQRADIVHVVDEIPVTTWFRPLTAPLREAGIPQAEESGLAWYLDAGGGTYRPLTGAAHRRLAGRAA